MAESRVECLSGVKTAQNSKKEGAIERKKNMKMWSWRKMCLGDFTSSRKTRRMQIPVLSEFSFKSAFRNKRTYSRCICLVFGILWNARPGEFLKLFVHKGTQQVACLVIIPSGCSLCPPPPQTIPYIRARLVWVPGYHSFPKWAIAKPVRPP